LLEGSPLLRVASGSEHTVAFFRQQNGRGAPQSVGSAGNQNRAEVIVRGRIHGSLLYS
jgi:hypothetical protein